MILDFIVMLVKYADDKDIGELIKNTPVKKHIKLNTQNTNKVELLKNTLYHKDYMSGLVEPYDDFAETDKQYNEARENMILHIYALCRCFNSYRQKFNDTELKKALKILIQNYSKYKFYYAISNDILYKVEIINNSYRCITFSIYNARIIDFKGLTEDNVKLFKSLISKWKNIDCKENDIDTNIKSKPKPKFIPYIKNHKTYEIIPIKITTGKTICDFDKFLQQLNENCSDEDDFIINEDMYVTFTKFKNMNDEIMAVLSTKKCIYCCPVAEKYSKKKCQNCSKLLEALKELQKNCDDNEFKHIKINKNLLNIKDDNINKLRRLRKEYLLELLKKIDKQIYEDEIKEIKRLIKKSFPTTPNAKDETSDYLVF